MTKTKEKLEVCIKKNSEASSPSVCLEPLNKEPVKGYCSSNICTQPLVEEEEEASVSTTGNDVLSPTIQTPVSAQPKFD